MGVGLGGGVGRGGWVGFESNTVSRAKEKFDSEMKVLHLRG